MLRITCTWCSETAYTPLTRPPWRLRSTRSRTSVPTRCGGCGRCSRVSRHAAVVKWDKVSGAITKKVQRRNELAHHQVLIETTRREGRRVLLRPAILDPH